MVFIRHELRQGWVALATWTAAVAFLLAICIFIFPQMQGEMGGMSEMFASMGGFTEAFGMDRVDFGSFLGFYAVECGNILGLGGALFAALCAVGVLAKEEREHTAEFLLTHPVGRGRIVAEKLAAVVLEVIIFNFCVGVVSLAAIALSGEEILWREIGLLHLAYLLLQLELVGICFGISAFVQRGGAGIGLGVALVLYFLNLIANMSDHAGFLKYVTPFAYADGAGIVSSKSLDAGLVCCGMAYGIAGVLAAFYWYTRKDIL